ncbi:2-keto-4-pentenoate hydratase [Aeromicrobium wangtongii]|uniref:Fumarylacetoacetate hydrolase family protein n=1 Tax=Aeromicrobium wangtongii TaxID=2969247 RepID=A0ABY5M8L5_9ACTN|nr:fumarylacetoacetate hydrolase family protein [Aeromicrobium wangtongii]MCD9199842.1 fumarylacetoacetate hydrolase family protein [Aeromicrobium wangtongii]UUP13461.1 fumarylacetoacetate hydrolase family protein [Aeromicrobium wangtongii]
MSSTAAATLAAADRLEQAQSTLRPTPPVRDILGSTDITAAYAVQDEVNLRRRARGAQVVGRKIGLTSPAVQQQLGVDQPDFGVLFDDMVHADGSTVPTGRLLQPKIEAEVAFVLAQDLDGELDLATVRGAVDYAVAALEIVDSRVADWDITITDTVADNGSSALYVLGTQHVRLDEVEPRDVEMSMSIDGEVVSTGNGAACLGDPLEALLWLARTAQEIGDPLRAGQVVLSGALGPMAPVVAGNSVQAQISRLGSVSVNFSTEENA